MNVNEYASGDINAYGDSERLPCTEFTLDALLKVQKPVLAENSQTGGSTRNALSETASKTIKRKSKDEFYWYALRAAYGCEKKDSSKTICASEAEYIIILPSNVHIFRTG